MWTQCARIYIQCFVLRNEVDELDNRHSGFWPSLVRWLWTVKTPLKMLATDAKNAKKTNLIRIFLWRMKISKAVCKRGWHTVHAYRSRTYRGSCTHLATICALNVLVTKMCLSFREKQRLCLAGEVKRLEEPQSNTAGKKVKAQCFSHLVTAGFTLNLDYAFIIDSRLHYP